MATIAESPQLREQYSYGAKKALGTLESFDDILVQYKKNWEVALANKL